MTCLLLCITLAASQATLPSIIPKPAKMTAGTGAPFEINRETRIVDPSHTFASKYLAEMVGRTAGFKIGGPKAKGRTIAFQQEIDANLPDEGYDLHVDSDKITIEFATQAGAFYAVQTLRQLLPGAIEGLHKGEIASWSIPPVDIEDAPRFPWRDMQLDVSRHFFPPAFIKRYIDYIAMMKMNAFHWHLVDDGGWRIEIGRYPRLTSVGAWRFGVTTDWDQGKLRFDSSGRLPKYGGYYTRAEVREIVKYAADRNITIIPEIEMPGHSMPVFAAYPELGCLNQPAAAQPGQPPVNVYCAGYEGTYTFIEDVLTEVMDLFPSKWIHIGGDEVDKTYWHRCPRCQLKMQQEGLKSEDELQSYFIRRVDHFLSSKGRRLIGWDEILEGGLAPGATVMSWRGIEGGIAAAKSGHDVVMTPTSHCYFDYPYQGQSTEHVYTFEPVPPELSHEEAKHVLGGGANVWTEMIPTPQRVEYMIWPRMAAMAEVLWSPASSRNLDDFEGRLPSLFDRLDRLGSNYYLPAPKVEMGAVLFAGSAEVAAMPDSRMPGTLRFTTNGVAPTADSPAYVGAVHVDHSCEVKFAYVMPGGRSSDVATVTCRPVQPASLANPAPGWHVSYYEGTWSKMPDFDTMAPVKTLEARSVSTNPRARDENFGLRFQGFFQADQEGVYAFTLSSDDGSLLKIADAIVVDNDGLHGTIVKTGRVSLPKGLHKIEVDYFQTGGAFSLSLLGQGPGQTAMGPIDMKVFRAG